MPLYFYFTGVYPVKFFEKDSEVDLTGATLFHWGLFISISLGETGNWKLVTAKNFRQACPGAT